MACWEGTKVFCTLGSFMQWIFIEHLLCTRHCASFWDHSHEEKGHKSLSPVELRVWGGVGEGETYTHQINQRQLLFSLFFHSFHKYVLRTIFL